METFCLKFERKAQNFKPKKSEREILRILVILLNDQFLHTLQKNFFYFCETQSLKKNQSPKCFQQSNSYFNPLLPYFISTKSNIIFDVLITTLTFVKQEWFVIYIFNGGDVELKDLKNEKVIIFIFFFFWGGGETFHLYKKLVFIL